MAILDYFITPVFTYDFSQTHIVLHFKRSLATTDNPNPDVRLPAMRLLSIISVLVRLTGQHSCLEALRGSINPYREFELSLIRMAELFLQFPQHFL